MYPEDLNSPHQELSNGGPDIVVAHLVLPGIDFSCVSTGGPIQLYFGSLESLSCKITIVTIECLHIGDGLALSGFRSAKVQVCFYLTIHFVVISCISPPTTPYLNLKPNV